MTFLETIVAQKRTEIAARRRRMSVELLHDRIGRLPPTRGFVQSLSGKKPLALIAELKKASPSKGTLRSAFDPVDLSIRLEKAGASALSVLTDEGFFQGHLEYLAQVKAAGALPLLQKDFVLDTYQVVEARAWGADAVLLIVALLSDDALRDLQETARALGMDSLVEVHSDDELERVNALDIQMVGINNRDLTTFEVDPGRALRLAARVPAGRTIVAESGIRSHEDVKRLADAGVHAILVGETIMRRDDVAGAVASLLGSS